MRAPSFLRRRRRAAIGAAALGAAVLCAPAIGQPSRPEIERNASSGAEVGAAQTPVEQFRAIEQELMDAVGAGDRGPWERWTDEAFVVTSEEGELIPRRELLAQLRPFPAGIEGRIKVEEVSVEELPGVAIVRFLADESQSVFGQRLATSYRVTDLFRRTHDSWRLVASHLSVITRDPPAQPVAKEAWPSLVGRYRLLPDGWTFRVELRGETLHGGREPRPLKPFVPLAPNVFVLSGSLGEWIFVTGTDGSIERLVELRKFEPLVWTRIDD